jgi:cytochrome c2
MNTGIYFKQLANLALAFLIFILSFFAYQIFIVNVEPQPQGVNGTQPPSWNSKIENYEEIQLGMQLFKNNCGSCHAKNMKAKMTGPALKDVEKRWNNNRENLRAWIRNSQAYLATGDMYTNAMYQEYGGSVMTAFPNLTDEEIDAILDYINFIAYPGGFVSNP